MICIDNTHMDIYFNLAAEEYLLKNTQDNIFMVWQSDHAVVIGKHQHVTTETDAAFIASRQIDIARRYSGGGAVYHDLGNINFTFIETTDRIDFDKYIKQVVGFLASIGIYAQQDERLGISVDGKKISGSAQSIYKGRVMYHCTLLYNTDLNILNAALNGKPGKDDELPPAYRVKSVRSEVTNLCEHLQNPPDVNRLKKIILGYFSGNDRIYGLNKYDLSAIEKLRKEKYAIPEWIFGKKILKTEQATFSPPFSFH